MKRLVGTIKRTSTTFHRSNGASHSQDSLEDTIIKALGDEYLHLPTIVEAAESSPSAAKAAANRLHKYLSKPNSPHEQRQYNAIMLIRILADNPGPTFTRNIDSRFVSSLKILLRDGQDVSVQQILRETLEFLATTKAGDTNLTELNSMWSKEKDKFVKQFGIHPVSEIVCALSELGGILVLTSGLSAFSSKDPTKACIPDTARISSPAIAE
ncbi:hypothetical protein CISG_00492 [Coccidioides immitis RMSCC 3703]|uniref:Uncharacterized protein n=1 Tax=Coccidioides immitis RMSCC 3703 TaxID=454286 RepID=A0A0J8QLW6_COCIT|nr:hypothetical protein CISG_00492 [Coccidioides immitis RMSCC 3703]